MIYIVLGLVGAGMGGAFIYGRSGFLLGGFLGLLAAAVVGLRNRLTALEARLGEIENRASSGSRPAAETEAASPMEAAPPAPAAGGEAKRTAGADPTAATHVGPSAPTTGAELPSLDLELADDAPDVPAAAPRSAAPPSPSIRPPDPVDPLDWIWQWLVGGNLMVRVGVVVLLFGFAFLVKYTAARDLVPLEVRLAGRFRRRNRPAGAGLAAA